MGGLATPYTNHQQHTHTMSTANHSVSKYRNQAQKLEEKQSCGAHRTDNGRVGSKKEGERLREREREREREVGMRAENHERLARSELARRPMHVESKTWAY